MPKTAYPEGTISYKITPGNGSTAILFCHSAIADHTMWDAQVSFLSAKGITCIQYDILGFGTSNPSQEYLTANTRPTIDHMKHIHDLITQVKNDTHVKNVVIAGLSMGAIFALRFATLFPDVVDGVVVAAGAVPGYEPESWPQDELDLDEEIEAAITNGEVEKAARLQVRYWGDGPRQKEGRCADTVRERLYAWCLDIARRRFGKTGGSDLASVRYGPITKEVLEGLNMPFAVGIGRFDEVVTNGMMEYLAATVKDVDVERFESAHMINLECPEEFNRWLYGWVEKRIG